jgi:hypothetical protein
MPIFDACFRLLANDGSPDASGYRICVRLPDFADRVFVVALGFLR